MPRKLLKGKVVSTKMNNAAVVAVEVPKRHPLYGKRIKNTRRFLAVNALGAVEGSFVTIQESKPVSKNISWRITEIAGEAK